VAQGREGQALAWHFPRDLPQVDILEADRPIVTALRLGHAIDLSAPPEDCEVHAALGSFRPAAYPKQMAGVILDSAVDGGKAQQAGADFLLLLRLPTADEVKQLQEIGLPWYLRSPLMHASATGVWRGSY
jgi:hypothetical protein